jgi:hypothetical protein
MREWIFPFGEKGVYDIVVPAWLNKTIMLGMNDQLAVEKGVKSWAGYLASTGDFGDNPFGDDTQRNAMFDKAMSTSKIGPCPHHSLKRCPCIRLLSAKCIIYSTNELFIFYYLNFTCG